VEAVQDNNPYFGDSDEETEYVFADTSTSEPTSAAVAEEGSAVVAEGGDGSAGEVSVYLFISCYISCLFHDHSGMPTHEFAFYIVSF